MWFAISLLFSASAESDRVLVHRGDEEEQQDPLSWLGTYYRPTAFKDSTDNLHDETTYVLGPVITLKAKSGERRCSPGSPGLT